MRNIKIAALLSVFALSTAAGATASTSTGYGSAQGSTNASGTYASNVSFTLPSGTLTIPTAQVRPGATFKVSIPVTNTTDRTVTFTAGTVTAPANVTVTLPATLDVNAGVTASLTYVLTFAADGAQYASLSGTTANFVFPVSAADTAAAPQDLTASN